MDQTPPSTPSAHADSKHAEGKIVLIVCGLTKTYGSGNAQVDALRAVDIDIRAGELLVLLGASGSGKSTLLNLLGGLLQGPARQATPQETDSMSTTSTQPSSRQTRIDSARIARATGCILLAGIGGAMAAVPTDDCPSIAEDRARLACYDRMHDRTDPQPVESAAAGEQTAPADGLESTGNPSIDARQATGATASTPPAPATPAADTQSRLSEIWELDVAHKRGAFNLVPHRANYLLLGRYSDAPNTLPRSPSPGHDVTEPLQLDAVEAKFQFSIKVKAWENIFGDNGDLWVGYTQQSNWQVYNNSISSPFRETNYEPEVMLALRTDANVLGWRWRLLNLGFVHQSNGRPLPLSRSWNRVYAEFGLERGNFTVLARPWWRINESTGSDDNPDIKDYLGSGDLRLVYTRGGNVFSALGRYSFSGNRGSMQLEWAFPISGALKGYVQATSGYGESLIDYNHRQNTLGVGILLVPWQ